MAERDAYDALKPAFDNIFIVLLKLGFSHHAIRGAFARYLATMPEDAGVIHRDEHRHP
jgi:hypothetical protein